MENVTKKIGVFQKLRIPITEKSLLRVRKWCLLIASLVCVSTAIDAYAAKEITTIVIIDAFVALALFVFATRCETLYLKMKVEKILESKLQ